MSPRIEFEVNAAVPPGEVWAGYYVDRTVPTPTGYQLIREFVVQGRVVGLDPTPSIRPSELADPMRPGCPTPPRHPTDLTGENA